jgi:hypothetical protein
MQLKIYKPYIENTIAKETRFHLYLPIINGEEIIRKHIRQMGQRVA